MIISKYSGNIVGYLDYHAECSRRVQTLGAISRPQRLKRDSYIQDESAIPYVRFNREHAKQFKPAKDYKPLSLERLGFKPAGFYTCRGNYSPPCGIGRFIDIMV